MKETQTFNYSKFSDENSRIILVKLIYLVNQGIQFNEQEVEQLVFRITKLFQSNNSRLRVLTYKTIKMIMPQKYIHILIQCLTKDLMSDVPWIKLQALKFIPFLQNEQYINQVERFVRDALIDTNQSIQSTALIVGIHIVNKFPILVGKWLFEVLQSMDQRKQTQQHHALILLHEIKKSNRAQFIQIMIMLIKNPQPSLIQFQIIRFIKEIQPILQSQEQKVFLTYLLEQMNNSDSKIFFESALILIHNQEIKNIELEPLKARLKTILTQTDKQAYIEKFSTFNLLEKLLKIKGRLNLFLRFLLSYCIAQKSLGISINLYHNGGFDLKTLFDSVDIKQCKCNFLNGLHELIRYYPAYGQLVLNFIQLIMIQLSDRLLVNVVLKLIEQIIMDSNKNIQNALETLFKVCEQLPDQKQEFEVIRIICRYCFDIQIEQLEYSQISLCYNFLKNQILNEIKEYQKITQEEYDLIRKEIINLKQNHEKTKRQTYLDTIQFDLKFFNSQSQEINYEQKYLFNVNQRQKADFFI
ncbi:hypothetical protein pb186bvf_000766 [Paramecium bursaria]